ncbi:MAG: thiolase family protein [Deltaproteobacteria bacterium]|nr:MAG: thiolase family protein [Deltaproteobacteria bacterium]
MQDAVICAAVRTPIGRIRGALARVRPDDLAAHVISALVERTGIDPAVIDDVYFGCANQAGEDNRNVARMALLLAGLPETVPGVTVNRLCASGLEAVNLAARAIRCGEQSVCIAGGVESMSRAPYALPKPEMGYATGNLTAYDTSLGWRFPNPKMEARFPLEAMGETAENLAERYQISREAQDRFALESHRRAVEAMENGLFDDEIVPVEVPQRKGDPIIVARDEGPRPDTSLEKLAALRPVFRKGGTVTAGNSSTLNDGASALLLASAEQAEALGLRPLARVVSAASAGVDPRIMGIGPVPATRRALALAGLELGEVDLVELNEAFAAQALAVIRELGLDPERVNPHGGAIALGHPLGCSGARILTTLVHTLRRRHARRGLATLCVGVGQGVATLVEAVA